MRRNRLDEVEFWRIARELNLDSSTVRSVVHSFFESFVQEARALPFDTSRKIYSKERFGEYGSVRCIPSIGRIGPSYSRYIKWRANVSKGIEQVPRRTYRRGLTQDDIEHIAAEIIAGKTPTLERKKNSEVFDRVWMVGTDGKKQARQVIPKKK